MGSIYGTSNNPQPTRLSLTNSNSQNGAATQSELSGQLEKKKRLRAYQNFLRIRENEKIHTLLEDFGSGVMNILKMPAQIKMPRFIEQGTNLITKGFEIKPKHGVPDAGEDKSFELPRRDISY